MTPDEKAHYYGRMEKNFPQFLKAMERLVAVPSYLKEDDDYPHVPAIKKVLDETMALMKDLGVSYVCRSRRLLWMGGNW